MNKSISETASQMTNPTAPSERLLYPNLSTVNEQ